MFMHDMPRLPLLVSDIVNDAECECLPGQVCEPCADRGYENGLAGYAARIYPDRVRQHDIDEQDRADCAADAN